MGIKLIIVSALFIASALFSFLLNQLLYRYSRTLGTRATEGQGVVRWGSTSKPTIGGISFFVTFLLATLVFFLTQAVEFDQLTEFLGLIVTVTLGFFIGLQDDAYNTRPVLKFLGQVTCGIVLIIFNTYIQLFNNPILDYSLTIFWVVGIMNSINLLDNMDGVTGTVSLVVCTITVLLLSLFSGGYYRASVNPFFFTMLALCGSFIGFLVLNWKPSKIYMGDTGSQFLGAFLAFIGIKFLWNIQAFNPAIDPSMQVIVPVMVFLVPIMDTTFVFIARIARGSSPFVGGKDHLTHHMSYLGVAEQYVPFLLGVVSLVSGLLAIISVKFVAYWTVFHTIVFSAFIVISFVIFFLLFKRGERIGYIRERFSKTLSRHYEEKQKGARPDREKEKQHS